jgi:hypothetical protein
MRNKKTIIIFGVFMALLMIGSSIMLRSMRSSLTKDDNVVKNTANNTNNTDNTSNDSNKGDDMQRQIIIQNHVYTLNLADNATARALAKLFPTFLNFNELNGNEIYAELPESLPVNANVSGDIKTGDVMLYGGNTIVIFYKDFTTEYSYTRLGRIENADTLVKDYLDSGGGEIEIR